MGRLLVDLLPLTILSALTPWTLVGVIVLLASKGGVRNAVAFASGWLTAILALGGLIVAGIAAGSAFGAFWINGFLVVPAALQISQADVTGGQKAFALVFYAVGATGGQIALIAYRLLAPERATVGLARLRGWVSRNSTATIAVVVAVIGGGLLVKAVVGIVEQL